MFYTRRWFKRSITIEFGVILVVKTAENILNEVVDTVSNYMLQQKPNVSSGATLALPSMTNKGGKVMRSAITERATGSLAASLAAKSRKAAIKRNKRFEELSQTAVGIGLRKAASATKGHAEFSATKF